MWTKRSIEQELDACDIEWAPKLMFLKYLTKKDKTIDAGCGFGKWVIFLSNRGYNITGIDNNEYAISKLNEYNSALNIKQGDILNFEYPDDYFDAYISMGVVEHFEEGPLPALKEAHRILKPNGLIFLSTPTVNIIRKLFGQFTLDLINKIPGIFQLILKLFGNTMAKNSKISIGNGKKYKHFIEYRFSISELQAFLEDSKFKIIETLPHDFPGSKDNAIGLAVDFPFLKSAYSVNFKLNNIGKFISRVLDSISPWIASASTLCVARAIK